MNMGNQHIYLYHENGRDYLYFLRQYFNQGAAIYDADIFSMTAEGRQNFLHVHDVSGTYEEHMDEIEAFEAAIARYTDKEVLISPDTYTELMNESLYGGYRSSLDDGTYDLELTGQLTEVPGGVMAQGSRLERVSFSDDYIRNLKIGDVIQVPGGWGTITVETLQYDDNGGYPAHPSMLLAQDLYVWLEPDGRWYLTDQSLADIYAPAEDVSIYIPDGCTIVDWSGDAQEKIRSSIREVDDGALQYGGEYRIENGAVTEITIFYHP